MYIFWNLFILFFCSDVFCCRYKNFHSFFLLFCAMLSSFHIRMVEKAAAEKNGKIKKRNESILPQAGWDFFLGFSFLFFLSVRWRPFFNLKNISFFSVCTYTRFLYEKNRAWRKEKMLRIDLTFHFVLIVSRFFSPLLLSFLFGMQTPFFERRKKKRMNFSCLYFSCWFSVIVALPPQIMCANKCVFFSYLPK